MNNKDNHCVNLKVEKFDYFKLNNHLSKFDISQNMVIFLNTEDNHIIDNHINIKHEVLCQSFKELDLNFINTTALDFSFDFENIIKYYIPFLSDTEKQQLISSNYSIVPAGKMIAEYLDYKGNVKSGFIFFDYTSAYIVEYDNKSLGSNSEEFFNHLFELLKITKEQEYDDLPINSFNPYENLDEDTLAKIKEIQYQLYELKQSGKLLCVLPMLKQILSKEIKSLTKSNIRVDEDYRIILPHFNNLEIQLSHLTKAVYVLFYQNPQGINIKELHVYSKELLHLYSNISYQLDYDKIQQSIDDLVNPESKAIYTHLSRIKSAFCKQMDYDYAKNYIILGNTFGSDMKYISILKEVHSQDLNNNTLAAGIAKPFLDMDNSVLFDPNEFDD